jgi:DNA polymerase I-like protein with 3'-5' exonuclease and polymerase domains
LGRDYLGDRKDEKLLRVAAAEWGLDPKSEMYKLPPEFVGRYAEQDAGMTLRLWERFRIELDKQDLWNIWNLETGLIPMMIMMRQLGVRVDVNKAEETKAYLKKRVKEIKDEIHRISGMRIEPWAANSLQAIFDELGLEYPKTENGAPSFTKQFLQMNEHPVAQMVVKLREFDKADSTFIDTILKHQYKGRIHCEFHQLRSDDGGTVTGRFCVAADTLIETQRGPVPIVQVKPRRDLALTHLGRFQQIRHLIYKGEEEMVALRVSSGMVIKCTRNHRVMTVSGWRRVGDLTVGQEITGVDFEAGLSQRGALPEDGGHVLVGRKADNSRGCDLHVRDISHSASGNKSRLVERKTQGGTGLEVLSLEAGKEEPNDWEVSGPASQLQGSSVLRPVRVCVGAETGLVHWPTGIQAHIRAQRCHGSDAWAYGSSGGFGCSSHRREPSQQSPGQLGVGDSGSPPYAARTVTVEAIEPLGVAQVWDIEVETDHSYVAHGLIHHNSSSNPNLQQIPARDKEIKKLIRGLFIPEDGQKWGSFDYSSQEPRLLVHFAASLGDDHRHRMVDKIVEAYHTGDVDLHQMVADFAGISRKQAKVVNLGIMYGMGKDKLAAQLDISKEEATDLLATHHAKVPFVKGLADIASKQAAANGQIRTILGRRCRFHLWEPASFGYKKPLPFDEAMKEYGSPLRRAFTYKALNKLIQGSAADQTKKAMADCFAEGLLPMLTVHDELCFSVEGDDQARRIKDIMENGLSNVLKVPSKVDVDLKDNWGEVE